MRFNHLFDEKSILKNLMLTSFKIGVNIVPGTNIPRAIDMCVPLFQPFLSMSNSWVFLVKELQNTEIGL